MELKDYGTNVERPDMKPLYIQEFCDCGTKLIPVDLLKDPNISKDAIWWDEWACPECYKSKDDGIWLDWPEGDMREFMDFKVTDDMKFYDTIDEALKEAREEGLLE